MEATTPLENPDRDPRGVVADVRALLADLAREIEQASDADRVALAAEAEALGRAVDALRVLVADEIDARSNLADRGRADVRVQWGSPRM